MKLNNNNREKNLPEIRRCGEKCGLKKKIGGISVRRRLTVDESLLK